jgi:hypothetical protein
MSICVEAMEVDYDHKRFYHTDVLLAIMKNELQDTSSSDVGC